MESRQEKQRRKDDDPARQKKIRRFGYDIG
jgi:hypothetical protein